MTDTPEEIGTAHVGVANVPRAAGAVILDRVAWVLYVFIFAAIPFAVLLFRAEMLAWHYYVAGAAFLAGALGICAINLQQMART